jgi:hypothetical protein
VRSRSQLVRQAGGDAEPDRRRERVVARSACDDAIGCFRVALDCFARARNDVESLFGKRWRSSLWKVCFRLDWSSFLRHGRAKARSPSAPLRPMSYKFPAYRREAVAWMSAAISGSFFLGAPHVAEPVIGRAFARPVGSCGLPELVLGSRSAVVIRQEAGYAFGSNLPYELPRDGRSPRLIAKCSQAAFAACSLPVFLQ